MDLDDSFTEGLLQRMNARKEYLNKKKTEFLGKKRAVLIDEHQVNSDEPPNKSPKCQSAQTVQASVSPRDRDNDKRQNENSDMLFVPVISYSDSRGLAALRSSCYGNEQSNKSSKCQSGQTEQTSYPTDNKENTDIQKDSSSPFVTGLSTHKIRGLAALRKNAFESEEVDSNLHATSENQVNKCDTYVFSTNSRDLCSGPKSRLAAIAADIRQWEDDSHKPTLSSNNGALSYTNAHNSLTQTNVSSVKLSSAVKSSNCHLFSHSPQSKGGLGTHSSCKQGNNIVSVGSGHKKCQVWEEAISAALDNPTSLSKSPKTITGTSDVSIKKSKDSQNNQNCNNEYNIYNNNSGNFKFDCDGNIKMELCSSPSKQIEGNLKLPDQESFPAVKNPSSSIMQDSVKLAVDPAELPLSARKALFENALMNGTPKVNKDITEHKLSVAERAAMFESASKVNYRPTKTNFNIPKSTTRADLSKFGGNSRGSPVKTAQPVMKVTPDIVKANANILSISVQIASPIKDTVPSLPLKHNGNHIAFIQQKLNEKYEGQEKEMEAKISEAPKQEISNLVHQWEKISSSSEKSSLNEERNDFASKEQISYDSDVNEEITDDESDHNLSCETENPVFEYEQAENAVFESEQAENAVFESEQAENAVSESEQADDCSDEDSEMADVFNPPDSEQISLRTEEKENLCERKDSCTSSQNTGSITGSRSPSYSGMSSYGSSYCASGSQSYTSDSSVRSEELSEGKKEKDSEVPLLYTVSFYRKQKQETRLTPVRTIVRCNKESSPTSSNTDYTKYIQERIKALQEEILRQQTVISQTSQALNLCSATAEFSGSMEQVEGERLLLISTQKRQACLNEVTRLKAFGSQGEIIDDGKGTLTITDLQLPLKREFIASQLEGKGSDTVHYFLCLIRHGAQVIVTQMMSTDDKTADGALCFTNHIQMQNLPADFSVIFEVYALQTKKEVLSHEKKYHIKREHSKIRLTPKGKKADGKILLPAISSPGGPNAVRSPSFGVVGYTRFTLLNCTKKTFTLDKVPFTSPLEGVLRVKLQLHAEHKIIEKGFLTMFEDVSGFGAWHRRWCALDTSYLSYWKYPDDEHKKEPIGVIDLKQCVTSEVKLASRDICARPHTFQMVTVRPQEKGDKNTLISRSVNTLTTTKHLLSADTKEERIFWCNKLNEALASVRKWDPRALKPINTA